MVGGKEWEVLSGAKTEGLAASFFAGEILDFLGCTSASSPSCAADRIVYRTYLSTIYQSM